MTQLLDESLALSLAGETDTVSESLGLSCHGSSLVCPRLEVSLFSNPSPSEKLVVLDTDTDLSLTFTVILGLLQSDLLLKLLLSVRLSMIEPSLGIGSRIHSHIAYSSFYRYQDDGSAVYNTKVVGWITEV